MKVFISSTYKDLIDYRAAAIRAVEGTTFQAVKMEVFGARPDEPLEACLNEVEQSDLFIGIYAHRYGFIPDGKSISITEIEYVHAKKLSKPIYCFLVDEEKDWKPKWIESEPGKSKLEIFKNQVQKMHTSSFFTSPEDLGMKVANALSRFAITNPSKLTVESTKPRKRGDRTRKQPSSHESEIERRMRLYDISRRIEDLLNEIRTIVNEEINTFSNNFSKKLAQKIVAEAIAPTLKNFNDEKNDARSLQKAIESEILNWYSRTETRQFVETYSQDWLNEAFVRIKKIIDPLLDLADMNMNLDRIAATAINSIRWITDIKLMSFIAVDMFILTAILPQIIAIPLIGFKLSRHSQYLLKNLDKIENTIFNKLQKNLEEILKQTISVEIVDKIEAKLDEQLVLLRKE